MDVDHQRGCKTPPPPWQYTYPVNYYYMQFLLCFSMQGSISWLIAFYSHVLCCVCRKIPPLYGFMLRIFNKIWSQLSLRLSPVHFRKRCYVLSLSGTCACLQKSCSCKRRKWDLVEHTKNWKRDNGSAVCHGSMSHGLVVTNKSMTKIVTNSSKSEHLNG